ncbi:DUF1599 domain-containing protein [Bacillaceae bacterium W0354]
MDRITILKRIDELEELQKTASEERSKQIEAEIQRLGQMLTLPRREQKIKALIKKGPNMMFSEVTWLLEQDFTRDEVAVWLNMSRSQLQDYLKRHGYKRKGEGQTRKLKPKGDEDVKGRAQGNIEEGKRLLRETSLSIPKISKMTGCTEANLYYHSSKIRGKQKKKRVEVAPKVETPVEQPKDKAAIHFEILQNMHKIYQSKNKDYGDSFGKQFSEYGIISSAIRLEDKFQRFKNLIKNKAEVKDESVEDTLLDMANYCVMTLIELRGRE